MQGQMLHNFRLSICNVAVTVYHQIENVFVPVSFHRHASTTCNETVDPYSNITLTSNQSCVNWHQYYTDCKAGVHNPFQGAISFDNIGLAWVAIFQVSIILYVVISIWEESVLISNTLHFFCNCKTRFRNRFKMSAAVVFNRVIVKTIFLNFEFMLYKWTTVKSHQLAKNVF